LKLGRNSATKRKHGLIGGLQQQMPG